MSPPMTKEKGGNFWSCTRRFEIQQGMKADGLVEYGVSDDSKVLCNSSRRS